MSNFSAEQFLKTSVTGDMDTKLTPVPARGKNDDPWRAQISKLGAIRGTDKNGEEYTMMNVTFHILDEEAKKHTGLEKPFSRQSLFLEFTPEGSLERGPGKNTRLGAIREATDQNKANKPWNPEMLLNQNVKVRTKVSDDGQYSEVIEVLHA